MSRLDDGEEPVLPASEASDPGVSREELEEILNDPLLPIEERRARLEELAARHGALADVERNPETDAFGLQIAEALNMLAEGGHDYTGIRDEGERPVGRLSEDPVPRDRG